MEGPEFGIVSGRCGVFCGALRSRFYSFLHIYAKEVRLICYYERPSVRILVLCSRRNNLNQIWTSFFNGSSGFGKPSSQFGFSPGAEGSFCGLDTKRSLQKRMMHTNALSLPVPVVVLTVF